MGEMLPCIVAKVERKVRVVIMAALKLWMEKRSEQLQWLKERMFGARINMLPISTLHQ